MAFVPHLVIPFIFGVAALLYADPKPLFEPLGERTETHERFSDTEKEFEDEYDVASTTTDTLEYTEAMPLSTSTTPGNRFSGWGRYWREFSEEEARRYGSYVRAPGPARVGVQVGHWKLQEVPEELSGLRGSSGAAGGGVTEVQVVETIGRAVEKFLEKEGVTVDLLPATVPVDYTADAFVSLHADGSSSAEANGFKIATPRRDFSGTATLLRDSLYDSYEDATGLRRDPNITRRMSGYYAFNWRRYDHAVHPMVPAVIVETGFLTNAQDRALLVNESERVAEGIADGIVAFLRSQELLP